MIIWTFKQGLCAALLLGCLSGCAEDGSVLPLLADKTAPPVFSLKKAELAGGKVTVVPPEGYCIDAKSLGRAFAALALCGAGEKRGGDGLITVSVTVPSPAAEPAAVLAHLSPDTRSTETTDPGFVLTKMRRADAPTGAMTPDWRGVAPMENALVSMAVFAADGSDLSGEKGGELLRELVQNMRDSVEQAATDPSETPSPQADEKRGLRAALKVIFR